MASTRRQFVKANLLGTLTAALPLATVGANALRSRPPDLNPRLAKLDDLLRQPVLKRALFDSPVIIETLSLKSP